MGIYHSAEFHCQSTEEVARFGYAFLWVCDTRKEICFEPSVQMFQKNITEQDILQVCDKQGDLRQLCDVAYDSVKGVSDLDFVKDYIQRQAGYHGSVLLVKENGSVITITCSVAPQSNICTCVLSNVSEEPLEKDDIEFSEWFAKLMKRKVEQLQTLADAGITPGGDK